LACATTILKLFKCGAVILELKTKADIEGSDTGPI
jgi:hypothetical protein